MNITQEKKEKIKSGNINALKEVMESVYQTNVNMLIKSAKGSDHDNQLKGKCQILAELIDLLP